MRTRSRGKKEEKEAHRLQGIGDELGDDSATSAGQPIDERVRHRLPLRIHLHGRREREEGSEGAGCRRLELRRRHRY